MRFRLRYRLRHKCIPGHLRQRAGAREICDGRSKQGVTLGRVGRILRVAIALLTRHGGGGFMVQVRHQHCSRLEVDHAIAARFNLLQGRGIDGDGRLRRPSQRRRLCARSSLDLAVERDPTVFGVHRPVVA